MMSCNGCRVLRKGCSESCILRPCLQWIDSPESQGHATAFVAKFFGRAGLMSFISAVPESQRPALFQSLLFEACGRTVNPVNGAVGLLWTGNWHVCQTAVDTILRGGALRSMPELLGPSLASDEEASEATCSDVWNKKFQGVMNLNSNCRFSASRSKRKMSSEEVQKTPPTAAADLDLCLTNYNSNLTGGKRAAEIRRRPGTPSMNSEESGTTTCFESGSGYHYVEGERKLLNLFV